MIIFAYFSYSSWWSRDLSLIILTYCPTFSCSGDIEEARPWLSWHLVCDHLCIFFLFVLVVKRPVLDRLDILPHLLLPRRQRGGAGPWSWGPLVLNYCTWSSLHIVLCHLGDQETCPWSSWPIVLVFILVINCLSLIILVIKSRSCPFCQHNVSKLIVFINIYWKLKVIKNINYQCWLI